MQVGGPAFADFVRQRTADEIEPAAIEPVVPQVGVTGPDQNGRMVTQCPEALLACLHGCANVLERRAHSFIPTALSTRFGQRRHRHGLGPLTQI